MFKKLDHIGIAVSDLANAAEIYNKLVGANQAHRETVESQKVEAAFFPVGEMRVELLQATGPDSPISRFIEKRGEGIHHICFEVEDLDAARSTLVDEGIQFIDTVPEEGAGGTRVAFIHPRSANGVLIELVEYPQR